MTNSQQTTLRATIFSKTLRKHFESCNHFEQCRANHVGASDWGACSASHIRRLIPMLLNCNFWCDLLHTSLPRWPAVQLANAKCVLNTSNCEWLIRALRFSLRDFQWVLKLLRKANRMRERERTQKSRTQESRTPRR